MPNENMTKGGLSRLVNQIQDEYEEGQSFLRPKKQRWVRQLVLMNNLRRGDQNIASSSLFSYFYRVIANLYDDHPGADFIGSEDSDYKAMEALKKLWANDYEEMDMALHDYDWLWDAAFFGEGYLETLKFDREKKLLMPTVLNPLTMVHDPKFSNPQQWRFYSKWILRSGFQINQMIKAGVIDGISNVREIAAGLEPEVWDYTVKREQAKDTNPVSESGTPVLSTPNSVYQILEHYTYDEEGNKHGIWVDKGFSKALRTFKIDFRDGETIGEGDRAIQTSNWPIVVKRLFREPHSTVGVSVPDLMEDKHRAKNVLLNLMYMAAKDEANPLYAYEEGALVDEDALLQRQVLQHIPVRAGKDPRAVIQPLNTKSALTQSLLSFMTLLTQESTEPIGTAMQQPVKGSGKKSATEAAMLQQIAELASSLQQKIIGFSTREFVSQWYQRYIHPDHIEAGDKKIVTISTVSGVTFEEIELDKIKTKYPPRVRILSSKEAEFKQMVAKREAMQFQPVIAKILTPKSNLNLMKYWFLPMFIKDSATVQTIIPDTIDEIQARQENEMLARGKLPRIEPTDDDEAHLYIHYQAKKSSNTWAHIFAHEKQLAEKKKQAEEAQAKEAAGGDQGPQPPSIDGNQGGKGPSAKSQPTDQSPTANAVGKTLAVAGKPQT